MVNLVQIVIIMRITNRLLKRGLAAPFLYISFLWKDASGNLSCLRPISFGAGTDCTRAGELITMHSATTPDDTTCACSMLRAVLQQGRNRPCIDRSQSSC